GYYRFALHDALPISGERSAASVHACVTHGRVHRRLFVTCLVVGQKLRIDRICLGDCLPQPCDIAVTEDAEDSGHRPLPHAAVDRPLVTEKLHQRLAYRHPFVLDAHRRSQSPYGSRESSSWDSHAVRTHPCAGSSVMFHTRSVLGPAITFR